MKISIVTLATDHIRSYADLTIARNRQYAKKHGYGFIEYTKTLDLDRAPSWSKIKALRENFADNDWLLWIDADAAVMNIDVKIEDLINEHYDFVFSTDINFINAGVFLVKCTQNALKFFEKIYSMIEYLDHIWWEQGAIHDLFLKDDEFRKSISLIRKDKINSYYSDYKPGDFILHLPGMSNEVRYGIFKHYLSKD